MTRHKLSEDLKLYSGYLDSSKWPKVLEQAIEPNSLQSYMCRKEAIDLYLSNQLTLQEIQYKTGVSPQNLRRLFRRCISLDSNGLLWGYRALLPQFKIKHYQKNILNKKNHPKSSGEFELLLSKYPQLQQLIEQLYFRSSSRQLNEPVMRPKYIFIKFIDECRKLNIKMNEYPFTTKNLGFRAIIRYLKKLEATYFQRASKRFGTDAYHKSNNSGVGVQNHPEIVFPYQRFQFDGHRIDAIFSIKFTTLAGDEVIRILDRIWILAQIDIATRCIAGYHITFNKEYNASDVMQCIRDTIIPKKKKNITIPGVSYQSTGGFPSELFSEMEWAVWDELCFDNAKAHLSLMVKDRLEELIGCAVNIGAVARPMRRPFIERFFETLEATGFHRIPSTTGGKASDPRRDNPEQKAIDYHISIEHLEQLVDVLISNYNGEPHTGLQHLSPLEALEQRLLKGMYPRTMNEEKRDECLFLQTEIKRTVRGNIKTGKRPYIQYEGVEYRSDFLSNAAHLINSEIILQVNIDDIRNIKAFRSDGTEIGYLFATGKWSLTPHTLQMRKQINQLVHRKLIHLTLWDDPIFQYTQYLKMESENRKARSTNKLAQVRRVLEKQIENSRNADENKIIEGINNSDISENDEEISSTHHKTLIF